jgi:ATP-dependent 26S proteasome regulatory subunit
MFYGVPGSGKTSTINAIASHFDADIYVIPISKELTDYGLIDAISYIDTETPENKKRMIVIEDIDSIFTDRKKGDDDNGITLQGLLNCFDGFSCVEGTLLFITANKPEVIDSAMLRSCRVDYKYELGYADEYQTKCIFERIAPKENKDNFSKFYKLIKNKEYTTAMLQEFLFFNRKCDDIFQKMNEFNEIIEKNKPGHFEQKKDNLYM